jgi:hypothetical protein
VGFSLREKLIGLPGSLDRGFLSDAKAGCSPGTVNRVVCMQRCTKRVPRAGQYFSLRWECRSKEISIFFIDSIALLHNIYTCCPPNEEWMDMPASFHVV